MHVGQNSFHRSLSHNGASSPQATIFTGLVGYRRSATGKSNCYAMIYQLGKVNGFRYVSLTLNGGIPTPKF